jgi:hypothetical protein
VSFEKAAEWARRKVRELEGATGQQWVSPARLDRLVWLESLCGGVEAVPRVLAGLEGCKGQLGTLERVEEAVRQHGGMERFGGVGAPGESGELQLPTLAFTSGATLSDLTLTLTLPA